MCHGLGSTAHVGALAAVERAFREYGLPRAIRTDNGGPFATKAIAGLSRLNIWWTQLGIAQDRIAPGHPEQNGSHERMHRTLKQATAFPPAGDMGSQQVKFDGFRTEFDFERPHEALGGQTPGSLYVHSPRELPETLPGPEYPGHCEIRQVRANGILYFKNQQIFLSELLSGHHVALEEIADGICRSTSTSTRSFWRGSTYAPSLCPANPRGLDKAKKLKNGDGGRVRKALKVSTILPV